jgi:hypothetical protein
MKNAKYNITLLLFLSLHVTLTAQSAARKGDFFIYWGYNRARFSKSTIYFKGVNYAFTLYNASARPTILGKTYFKPSTFTVPQYNARLGYYFKRRWALSFGIDHLKYVLDANQHVPVSGVITAEASPVYAGNYLYDTLVISPDFVSFEHTDGLNLVSIDLDHLIPLFSYKNIGLLFNTGIGGLWMATRTDSRIFEKGINNNFHVSGFTFHVKAGPRIELGKHLFFLFELRGDLVSLPWIQLRNWTRSPQNKTFFSWNTTRHWA